MSQLRTARIDYVKFQYLCVTAESSLQTKQAKEARFEMYRAEMGEWPGSFHHNKVYDGKGNWYDCFDVAGSLAHRWMMDESPVNYSHITRLDIRWEATAAYTSQELDAIYELARQCNTGNRNINRKHARPRTKSEGRDAGGDLLSIGSLKSDKYFAVYTKPREHTAFELKLTGKPLGVALQHARTFARFNSDGTNEACHALVRYLQTYLDTYTNEVTGRTPHEWDTHLADTAPFAVEDVMLSAAEQVLADFDALEQLDQLLVYATLVDMFAPEEVRKAA